MTNYYRRFLPRAVQYQAPLLALLKGVRKNDKTKINWTPELREAFSSVKQSLADATLLAHPHPQAQLALFVDASDIAVGGVVQQKCGDDWQPLGFYSEKLSESQKKYSAYDRELLAAYSAIKHFRHVLEARIFTLYTDHKPLTFAFHQRSDKCSPRQLRHLDYIGQFTTDIRHISGLDNVVADTLSRADTITFPGPIDYELLSEDQSKDQELASLLANSNSLQLTKITVPTSNLTVYCDISTGTPRPYITPKFRKQIFDSLHNLSHPGTRATNKLIRKRFVWPSMLKDCSAWTRSCLSCQKSKIHRHTRSPLADFPLPEHRFSHVNIDIIGPLPPSRGFSYCLTCIDRYSRWPEAIPVSDITADTIARAFYANWISRYGVPLRITTDQGRQFESSLFTSLAQLLGSKKIHTTAYHPQANGMIERWHRVLKTAIKCHATDRWVDILPTVLLGLRSAVNEDIGASSAEFVFGKHLSLPGHLFQDDDSLSTSLDPGSFVEHLKQTMSKIRPIPPSRHAVNKTFISQDLKTCTHVFLRNDTVKKPLQAPYDGPFEVVARTDKTLTIKISGKPATVSLNRVKPAYILSSVDTGGGVLWRQNKPTLAN